MFQRRLDDRYRLTGSALVIFERPRMFNIGQPRIIKLGPLSDISQSGLSVEYIADKKKEEMFDELSIFVPGQGIVVYRLPFRTISDIKVVKFEKKRTIMRRGIKFRELNEHHFGRIKRFLRTDTRGIVPDRRSGCGRRYVNESHDPFISISGWENDNGKRSGNDRRSGVNINFDL